MQRLSSLFASTKLVLFSDCMTFAKPHLKLNLLRANKNESLDRSLANSIWIAQVVRHVYITP